MDKINIKICFLAFFIITAVYTVSAYARVQKVDTTVQQITSLLEEGPPNDFEAYTRYLPYSGVEAQSGKIGMVQAGGYYSHELKLLGKLPVILTANIDYMNIDKTVEVPLPVSLIDLEFDIETRIPLFNIKNMYVGVGINPTFMCDSESFGANSFTIPTRFFLVYVLSDNLIIAGGAEFFENFDNDVGPVAGLIYRPVKELTFNITTDESYITYEINRALDIFAEEEWKLFDEYKVKKAGDNDVLLAYQTLRIGGGFNYKPTKYVKASVSVGGVFMRSLEYLDAGGKLDIDKGMYVQGRVTGVF